MLELGYALSSEEHSPTELVNFAQQAEAVGFNFAMLSDHGPDPRVHNKAIQKFVDAGFDHVYASNRPESTRLLPFLPGTGAAAGRCFPEERQRFEERK